jgi:hypothetical protein
MTSAAAQPAGGAGGRHGTGPAGGRLAGPGPEHGTRRAAQRDSSLTGGISTLEVRWIFPGELETAVAGWFGRFTAGTESREDTYLLSPHLPSLSVKVPGGRGA